MMSRSLIIRLWPQDFFPCYFVSEAEEHTNGSLIKMDGTSNRPIFMIIRELNAEPCKTPLLLGGSACGGMCRRVTAGGRGVLGSDHHAHVNEYVIACTVCVFRPFVCEERGGERQGRHEWPQQGETVPHCQVIWQKAFFNAASC